MAEDIRVEKHDGWVEVTIHRPDKLNAIREQTAIEILEVMTEVEADRSLKGLIITGSEKAFCTGVDTSEQKNEPDEAFELWRRRKRSRKVNQFFRALPEFTKPVIAAVEGFALGGGFEIALLCDFIVASESAQFGLPEAKLGLMPGGAGTQTLPRLLGKPLAKELIWTGRRVKAAEALQLRIANHVVPAGKAVEKAREILKTIGEQGPLSVMFTKSAIERGLDVSLSEGMSVEADAFFALSFSQDRNEGLSAFREKRSPNFKGN
ncbi:enoyl-CoA hydratase/isomerase family protein [Bradyrhizobium liaoningense]|uniref:enoyl-CoA hydratase/isomerase family protein n=1 Tax=Bradyrhizobium liaoningense TaxID=43992 RepID=UPI001BA78134|nr:enoyl-CoA hydratase-related protein [Bradyrhizobium liaoningense]MBR0988011.1 enoyl-CoA hydratase/isomerase family protein [Bradyrhizobium liaoningense]